MRTFSGLLALVLLSALTAACGGQPGEGHAIPLRGEGNAKPASDGADDGIEDDDGDGDGGEAGGDAADAADEADAGEGGDEGGDEGGGLTPPAEVTSESAFKETVYPLVRDNCKGCHAAFTAPFFAHEDPALAHKALLEAGKVNFGNLDRSRLYLRLAADNHNCWSQCPDDAAKMQTQLASWLDKLVKAGKAPATDAGLESTPLMFKDTTERDANQDVRTLGFEAESGTIAAPMVMTDVPTASGGKVIQVPTGAAVNNSAQANAGTVVYNFEVKEAGTYSIWALANAPTAAANRFFFRVDAGAFQTWTMPVNAADFTWMRTLNTQNQPFTVNLTAGAHTLEIKRSRTMAKLDLVAVTSDAGFDGSQVRLGKVKVMKFDLSEMAKKPGVMLELEVADFNEGAYKIVNPRLIVPAGTTMHVKGLRVLLNGEFDPQLATYSLINTDVAAPGALLSPAAMVMLKDKGVDMDQFSLSFEELVVK